MLFFVFIYFCFSLFITNLIQKEVEKNIICNGIKLLLKVVSSHKRWFNSFFLIKISKETLVFDREEA